MPVSELPPPPALVAPADVNYSARDKSGTPTPRITISLPIAEIHTSVNNPRQGQPFAIEGLADSIRLEGLLSPITVRHRDEDNDFAYYEIVAGSRRFTACKMLGWTHIDAYVVNFDDENIGWAALAENIQREDLNPIDVASAIKRQMEKNPRMTQGEVAHRLGKSQPWVAAKIGLLDLPGIALRALSMGWMSESHGKALIGIAAHPAKVEALVAQIQADGLSAKATEQEVARIKGEVEKADREREAQNALPFGDTPTVAPTARNPILVPSDTAALTDSDMSGSDLIDEEESADPDAPRPAESDDEVILPPDAPDASGEREQGAAAVTGAPSPANYPLPAAASGPTIKNVTPGATSVTPSTAAAATTKPSAPTPASTTPPVATATATATAPAPVAAPAAADGTMVVLSNEWDDWLFEQDLTFNGALDLLKTFLPTPMTQKLIRILNDDWREQNPDQETMNESQALEFFLTLLAKTKGIDLDTVRGLPL